YGPTWKDVMTYCSNQWVSDFTYEGIRSYLVSVGDANPSALAQANEWLAVMGMAYLADNTGQIESAYLLAEPIQLTLPEPGEWTIALVDAGGMDVATYPFEPNELTDAEESPRRPAVISEIVPWVSGAVRVEIRYGDQVVDAREASANAPTVRVTSPESPIPDQIQQQTPLLVQWVASDPDGDPLTFSILYSDTGGETWETLATGLTGDSFEIDPGLLPGGQSSQVRVVASDGMNGSFGDSPLFSVPLHAPEVEIVSPLDGQIFYPSQLIVLEGSTFDLEDGELTGDRLEWESSIDGPLGTGTMTSTVDLSTGQHVITLVATDFDGMSSEVQVTIEVLPGDTAEPDVLEVAPVAVGVVVMEGDPASDHMLSVRNGGEGVLAWTASEDAAWLQLSSSAGDSPSDLTLTVDPTGLAPGDYEAEILFTSAGAMNSPVVMPVILTVQQTPTFNVYLPMVTKNVQ
ncbi:MAG: BACON domain-containing protein, partial [Anaerolineae bacterium]|nr:BACON domain-containing protein [Anaerolineae bacterium]